MINTYNESELHSTLKKIYALESNGIQEVQLDDTPWICDILTEDKNVIEIQTSNLSALKEKTEYILETGRKIKIVHPVFSIKWLELYDSNDELIYRKKSPKKSSLFDSLRGMTKIAGLFLHKNCQLEILYCEITEMRKKTDSPSQTKNKSRRYLKDWLPMGKKLEKILEKKTFSCKEDWENLLPQEFRQKDENKNFPEFRLIDLQKSMEKTQGKKESRWANLLIWIFLKMGILKISRKEGRSKFYSLV